jgi:hypothetical protein
MNTVSVLCEVRDAIRNGVKDRVASIHGIATEPAETLRRKVWETIRYSILVVEVLTDPW